MSVKIAERLPRVRSYGERRIALGPGVVWFANPDLGTGLCFPIQKLGYRARLTGPAGAVEAFLTYVNPTADPQDAIFLYPLDRNVSPVKIRGKCADRQIETEVGPAPLAGEEDDSTPLPAELCRLFAGETENVLAIPLGQVPAGQEVTFQILSAHMVNECAESGAGFSFRLPLMVSDALSTLNAKDAAQLSLAKGLDRGAQVAVSIQIEASDLQPGQIASSQACAVARNPSGDLAVEYDRRKPLEARDFVLDYQLWNGNRPKAWLRSQGRHFLLNFFPPSNPTPSTPRRLVILVDGSEEMSRVGEKRCTDCLASLLNNLDAEDRFALVAFNREVSGYKNGDFVEATLASEALTWMQEYQFTGGADLKELLRRVITLPRQPHSVLSVVLVSAGRIGNEAELYRLLQGSRDILRLFPILLGPKADPHFSRASARLTGGYAYRALTPESISRAAERVLEHSRQPVLEGVGFQDKGLQYQGESLTPKYPSGLNWRRPISVMGTHAGRGGLEACGTGPGGATWTEFVEVKPAFHKVLANVWAHIKASELDDEAHMLDRAERGILQNVIKNLSREFSLLNQYTAVTVRGSDGSAKLSPAFAARLWFKKYGKETVKGKSANELIEEQRSQQELKGELVKQGPGRGLKMKEVLGSKATVALVGSKLGHRNKLSGAVKEGLFSKPMLKTRGGSQLSVSRGKPFLTSRGTVGGSEPPKAKPVSPATEPEDYNSSFAPTEKLEPAPSNLYGSPGEDRVAESTESKRIDESSDFEPLGAINEAGGAENLTEGPKDSGFEPMSPVEEPEPTMRLRGPTIGVGSLDLEEGPSLDEEPQTLRPMRSNVSRPPTISAPVLSLSGDDDDEISPDTEPSVDDDVIDSFAPSIGNRESKHVGPPTIRSGSAPVIGQYIPDPEPSLSKPSMAPTIGKPVLSAISIAEETETPEPSRPPEPKKPPEPQKPPEPPARTLPTPRELASKVSPGARSGKPEETARNALRSQPEVRKSLMAEMRLLHGSIGKSNDTNRLGELTDAVLFRLAEVAPNSELLVRAYGLGYQARGMLAGDLNEAKAKLNFWLSRFAKLF